jgi:hypothetical protein
MMTGVHSTEREIEPEKEKSGPQGSPSMRFPATPALLVATRAEGRLGHHCLHWRGSTV